MAIKYPPEHYPNSGIQHTRAVVAIGLTRICLDGYGEIKSSCLKERVERIRKWADTVAEQTKNKVLSAGARRANNRLADALEPYLPHGKISQEELDARWAALIWVALTFCEDVRATCPEYSDGPHKMAWRYLVRCMAGLAEYERVSFPAMDVAGTAIYEECFDAMQ